MEQHKLPNATAVLVLGILSVVGCCCLGLPGVIFSVIALILANKDMKLYKANPELYTNYNNLNTGRIIAIIGLVISILVILKMIYSFVTEGHADYDYFLEEFRKGYEQGKGNKR